VIVFLRLSISFSLLAVSNLFSYGQSDCILRKDADGIKVYTCKAEHTKLKSIKATFSVNVSSVELVKLVKDIAGYNEWQYNTTNARVLKVISDDELIYYAEVVAPWPISNRDLVVHLKVNREPLTNTIIISANSLPDYTPNKKGIVRVPMSTSQWVIRLISESSVSVDYTMLINPGGSVPAWMVNMVAEEAPYMSFRDFKKIIELR
jgi:START domain